MVTIERSPHEREKHKEKKTSLYDGEESLPFLILHPNMQVTPDAKEEIKLRSEINKQKKK